MRGIGGGDAAAVLGQSPWQTPYELWLYKTYRTERRGTSPAMQRGIDKEDAARQEFRFEYGDTWQGPVNMVHHDHPQLRAQIDDLTTDGRTLLEIKVPGRRTHEIALRGEIPEHYAIQMDHEMLVSGAERAAYVSWDEDGGCVILWRERDEERLAYLLRAELDFWELIQNDEPPELMIRDMIVRMDDKWNDAASAYIRAAKAVAEAEEKAKEARDILVSLANGKSSVGGGVQVTVYPQRGKISYKSAVDELVSIMGEPFDLEQFRGPGTTITKVTLK